MADVTLWQWALGTVEFIVAWWCTDRLTRKKGIVPDWLHEEWNRKPVTRPEWLEVQQELDSVIRRQAARAAYEMSLMDVDQWDN